MQVKGLGECRGPRVSSKVLWLRSVDRLSGVYEGLQREMNPKR